MRDDVEASGTVDRGEFVVRPARESDLAGIERIERASFADPWPAADFRAVLSAAQAIFLVAADNEGNVAGYVLVLTVFEDSEVLNIAVDPAARGMSIGGTLLDAGMSAARRRGAREIFLEVRESNEAALRLYRSHGFEALSRRKKYYRTPVEDALVLRRAL